MREDDVTQQFPGMEDEIPDGDRSRLRINATLKDCNLKAKKDDEVYKIVLEVSKDHVDMDARLALTELTGKDVSLYMCSVEYLSFQNAKARGMDEARKRADATARQERSDAGEPIPVTLKAAKILTIGDFKDGDGNIFTVVENDGKFVTDAIGDSDKLAELDLPTDEHESEDDARKALKEWAGVNRGMKEICPSGFANVWAGGDLRVIRVGENCEEEEGYPVFCAFTVCPDGSEAIVLKDDGLNRHSTTEDAQSELDTWADQKKMALYGFIRLADVVENDDEPAMPTMIYRDGEGNSYYVADVPETEATPAGWAILVTDGDAESPFKGPFKHRGEAQTTLSLLAEENGWTPKPITELLAEASSEESAEPAEETATETAEEPAPEQPAEEPAPWEEEAPTEPATESPTEEPAAEPVAEATQEAAEQASEPEAAEHAPLYDDIAANWGTDKQIGYLIKAGDKTHYKIDDVNFDERSVKLFGYGTIFADELQEKYRVAPPEEPKPEPVKEPEPEPAPEPTPEPEPEPVEATVDPFEDGGSIADLHDFLMKNKGRKDLKLRTKATDGQSAGSSKSILAVVEEGVRMVGVGLVTKDEINEKWEVAK